MSDLMLYNGCGPHRVGVLRTGAPIEVPAQHHPRGRQDRIRLPSSEPRRASASAPTTAGPHEPSRNEKKNSSPATASSSTPASSASPPRRLSDLEAATDEITQVAASVGLELRPLHGRHDQAVAATLPIARGLAPKGR